jgi:hypothetical protein
MFPVLKVQGLNMDTGVTIAFSIGLAALKPMSSLTL